MDLKEKVISLLELFIAISSEPLAEGKRKVTPCAYLADALNEHGAEWAADHILRRNEGVICINYENLLLRWRQTENSIEMWLDGRDLRRYPLTAPKLTKAIQDAGFEPKAPHPHPRTERSP